MELLTERYADKITGILSCYDRVVITGTMPQICYAAGLTSWLYAHAIRIFDYPNWADQLRLKIRENAERIAKENGIEIEHIKKSTIRKEDHVQRILKSRGYEPGLVHIISCMETCDSYKPWHDKTTHQNFLKPDTAKCLHYYFYFIDDRLGLCYLRVPTWCPFRLQFYFNGHNWLASELEQAGITYSLLDNAFLQLADFAQAQKLSDQLSVKTIHQILDQYSRMFCPVHEDFDQVYHWSIMQAEYATDIVFKKQSDLQAIYEELIRTAIHTVKPDNIATFLGHKLHGNYEGEMGNNYRVRIEGTRIKHSMGKVSIKMYDKYQIILRIETTVNDVTFFKHYRTVEQRDGTSVAKIANMKKNIYSLAPLQEHLKASNRRYLEFISTFQTNENGYRNLDQTTRPIKENGRSYRGFNFFDKRDLYLMIIIARGEFNISGMKSKNLKAFFPDMNSNQISRLLKRLRLHGLVKRVAKSYKYYLTKLGKTVIATALKLKENVLLPSLSFSYA
jgi:hypothetical protein